MHQGLFLFPSDGCELKLSDKPASQQLDTGHDMYLPLDGYSKREGLQPRYANASVRPRGVGELSRLC
jgi:hypothetical protein